MPLSTAQLNAAIDSVLSANGYIQARAPEDWPSESRLYEDDYGIVAVQVFDTWRRLRGEWNIAQGRLVDLLSERLGRPDPKAWEGYLLLCTSAVLPSSDRQELDELRYDTNRLRKLVATGDDLETIDDVQTALLPLLPLKLEAPSRAGSGLLSRLPDLLEAEGINVSMTQTVVNAFLRNELMMESLHERGAGQ